MKKSWILFLLAVLVVNSVKSRHPPSQQKFPTLKSGRVPTSHNKNHDSTATKSPLLEVTTTTEAQDNNTVEDESGESEEIHETTEMPIKPYSSPEVGSSTFIEDEDGHG